MEITKAHLSAFVLHLREQGMSPGGCNCYIRSVNSFLTWLHTEEHIREHLRVKLLRNPSKPHETFSDAETRALMTFKPQTAAQARAWTLTLCLIDTGIRIDEALGLEQSKVNLDDFQMRVLGKGSKERIVPFSHEMRKHLYRLITKRPGKFVFQTAGGERLMYRNAYRDIKAVCALAALSASESAL